MTGVHTLFLLHFLIDGSLLLAANRLSGFPPGFFRCAVGALIGGVYGAACLLPGFRFLGSILWRLVSLGVMSLVAFGMELSSLRRGLVFSVLCLAMGGLALGIGRDDLWGLAASAVLLFFLCVLGFRDRIGAVRYIPVELNYRDRHLKLTALQDTGNRLTDPVTGSEVLVIGPQAARQITGLTQSQLENPVESIGTLPGLRLIPFHSVGQASGLMLGMRLPKVKIGSSQGSRVVAFSPNGLCSDGTYQALTGGSI